MSLERAARAVLRPAPNEDEVKHRIALLLTAMGHDEYRLEAPVGRRRIDIELPRLRIIIEVKAQGKLNAAVTSQTDASPFNQLEDYVLTRIRENRESQVLEKSACPWTGILTDGQTWYRWTWPQRDNPVAQPEDDNFRPASGPDLTQWLSAILSGEPIGRPWIPQNPVRDVSAFRTMHEELRKIHDGLDGNVRRDTLTKMNLWRDMLRSGGMDPSTQTARARLFVSHSFLIALARGVIWTIENPDRTSSPDPDQLLADGFGAWVVQTHTGRQWAKDLLSIICSYDWRQRQGDVLRPLYEAFVDANDRRDFGEVYTPDWLASLLVQEILDDAWCTAAINSARVAMSTNKPIEGVGVLDPCCGSGTFLYHATQRILSSPDLKDDPPVVQAGIVQQLVCGMDIHPVACEFARATLMRALTPGSVATAQSLRIWNGDALMLRREEGLFMPRNGQIVIRSPGDGEIRLPGVFFQHPQFADWVRRLVEAARNNRPVPGDIIQSLPDGDDREMVTATHRELTGIIRNEGNSVWAWFINHSVGPHELARRKVNRIVTNPPWVRMSTIQHEPRKQRLIAYAQDQNLWQGGKQAPHFDIAQLVVRAARETYLKDPDHDRASWIVKHSAIRGGNWEAFRRWRKIGPTHRAGGDHDLASDGRILDLADVQVFGPGDAQKCCVLIDNCQPFPNIRTSVIIARCPNGRPRAAMGAREANGLVRWEAAPPAIPKGVSDYEDVFRQGATIVPHVLTIAEQISGDGDRRTVTTRQSKQEPWRRVDPQVVDVPKWWLVPHLRSDHILPFSLAPNAPDQAIIPVNRHGGLLSEADIEEDSRYGGWSQLEDIYQSPEYRGRGQNTPQSLIQRIDYAGQLDRQLPAEARDNDKGLTRVLYPGSGDVMRAARTRPKSSIVDSTLYWCTMTTAQEAAYVVALLNAMFLREAFVQARASGRDFHLSPWKNVPIPAFDPASEIHQEIVNICEESEAMAQEFLSDTESLPGSQSARARRIREHLEETGLANRLNRAVREILPDQCHL
ncbi:MAG: N-6 DNA methylase [Rhodobacteraceae bacterium]|nr:N-6 DNA methylase [Paracoccaceae bacterium]